MSTLGVKDIVDWRRFEDALRAHSDEAILTLYNKIAEQPELIWTETKLLVARELAHRGDLKTARRWEKWLQDPGNHRPIPMPVSDPRS